MTMLTTCGQAGTSKTMLDMQWSLIHSKPSLFLMELLEEMVKILLESLLSKVTLIRMSKEFNSKNNITGKQPMPYSIKVQCLYNHLK